MSDDWLDVQEFSKLVGCSTARLRLLVRCGLLKPWGFYLKYGPAEPIAATPRLVVMAGDGAEVVTFSAELLTDPRFLVLATNSIDPVKWGPGWNGPRDAKLVGFLDPKRVRVLEPGKKVTQIMRRIGGIPTRTGR